MFAADRTAGGGRQCGPSAAEQRRSPATRLLLCTSSTTRASSADRFDFTSEGLLRPLQRITNPLSSCGFCTYVCQVCQTQATQGNAPCSSCT